jgi:hypothetical protein
VGEYSTYLTDEQRRDATQMRDFTTGVKPFGALVLLKRRAQRDGLDQGQGQGQPVL